jgi:hypothetical protein
VLIGDAITLTAVGGDPDGTYEWTGSDTLTLESDDGQGSATFRAQATGDNATINLTYTAPDDTVYEAQKQVKVQVPTSDRIVAGLGVDSEEVDPFADGPPVDMQVIVVWEVLDQDGEPVRGNNHTLQERITWPPTNLDGGWQDLGPVNNNGQRSDPKGSLLPNQAFVDAWNQIPIGAVVSEVLHQNRMVLNAGGGEVICTFCNHHIRKTKSSPTSFKLSEL